MDYYLRILEKILGIVPKIYLFVTRFLEVDTIRADLNNVIQELVTTMQDMEVEVQNGIRQQPGRTRRRTIDAYFSLVQGFRDSAQEVLNGSHDRQLTLIRMTWVPIIDRHLTEGQDLLGRLTDLRSQGLTIDEIRTRGEMLPVEEDQFMVPTVRGILENASGAIQRGGVQCIGIHGYTGSGKTNLMKHLHNIMYQDNERFKGVFWATAPELELVQLDYYKALQRSVADGMYVDLGNDGVYDEVRNASKIFARLQDIGPGRAVLFLDNVQVEFPGYELLGIPSPLIAENGSINCVLVFSTLSEEVCNRMRCDLTLKMELLEEEEARDLFLNEVGLGVNNLRLTNREMRIQETAVEVARECKRMPLAIIVIARAMVNIEDPREWNNRLNELIGRITRINEEEDVILEQLKFGYLCLRDETVKRCFVNAARELVNDRQVSKGEIISMLQSRRLIRQGDAGIDQGHTVLNQLERMCFLQVGLDYETLTMNKWICKMADKVSREPA